MSEGKTIVAVFDTKPYDREYLSLAIGADQFRWKFLEFRLTDETAVAANGADVACVFVNDIADLKALECLASSGVRHLALRCAGFNNVDLAAARKLGITVTRVPSYSPHVTV